MSVESLTIALHHSRAKGAALAVLVGIANHDGDGGAWPSIKTLAKYGRCNERNAKAAVQNLARLGEIRIHQQQGGTSKTPEHLRPNLYEFLLRCPADCDGTKQHRTRQESLFDRVSLTTPGVADDTPPGVVSDTPPGVADDTRTIHNNPPLNTTASPAVATDGSARGPVDIRPAAWCRCSNGWLEPSLMEPDVPRPCLRCKPHLARTVKLGITR